MNVCDVVGCLPGNADDLLGCPIMDLINYHYCTVKQLESLPIKLRRYFLPHGLECHVMFTS